MLVIADLDTPATPPPVHDAGVALSISQPWASPKSAQTSPLLRLPREIRDAIIGELFFPGEREPEELDQNWLGLATTAVRQIFPYARDRDPKFDTAILRTCQQLQEEGEAILYGTSSWNLMYQDWDDDIKFSYEHLERFPKRLRRLIRRVERKCYSEPYAMSITLYDWKLFITFLARECPNLHSLKLWGPGDRKEGLLWVKTCKRDAEWVQAILQIKTLLQFDIPVIRGGLIYDFPDFKDDFLPWLKSTLLQQPQLPSISAPLQDVPPHTPFRILDLPRDIRNRIYRFALLPPTRRIHPYIKAWYDETTQNVLPLFLACKQIHRESESIFFGKGISTAPTHKYEVSLLKMLRDNAGIVSMNQSPSLRVASPGTHFSGRQVRLIKHIRMRKGMWINHSHALLSFVTRVMELDSLELVLADDVVDQMNREWRQHAPSERGKWIGDFSCNILRDIARIPTVNVETSDAVRLDPACREWFTKGLRREALSGNCNDPEMQWLHVTLSTTDSHEAYDWDGFESRAREHRTRAYQTLTRLQYQ